MNVAELLEQVTDRKSFIAFVEALAEEREQAEEMEQKDLIGYQLGGALGWQNSRISAFLYAALRNFESGSEAGGTAAPSWKDFAEFLWCGKIIE